MCRKQWVVLIFLQVSSQQFVAIQLPIHIYCMFSSSLGLVIPPRVRFLKKQAKFQDKMKKDLSAEELINKLISTAPDGGQSVVKSTDSGNESASDESGNESENDSSDSESDSEVKASTSKASTSKSKKLAKTSDKNESDDSDSELSEDESEEEENAEESDSSEEESKTKEGKLSKQTKTKAKKTNSGSSAFTFDIGDDDLEDILTVKKRAKPKGKRKEKMEEEEKSDEPVLKLSQV